MTIDELITALEGNRHNPSVLNAELALLVGWTFQKRKKERKFWWRKPNHWHHPNNWERYRLPPNYISSLGRLAGLIVHKLPDCPINCDLSSFASGLCEAKISERPLDGGELVVIGTGRAETPACALCIAFLRALQLKEGAK